MQQSEFEKEVQQKLKELKLSPADAVWEKVAAGLPAEKKPRRWILFMLLFAGLLAGSLLLWNKFSTGHKKMIENNVAAKSNTLPNNIAAYKAEKENAVAAEIAAKQNNKGVKIQTGITNDNNKTTVGVKVKIRQAGAAAANNPFDINTTTSTPQYVTTKSVVKSKTKAPVTTDDDVPEFIAAPVENNLTADGKTVVTIDAPVAIADNLIEEKKNNADDSSDVPGKDVIINKHTAVATAKKTNEKKKNHLQWQFGARVAAGAGVLKKDLFSSTALFSADARLFNSAGVPPPSVQVIATPNNPATGAALNFGVYAQKNIGARWKFSIGLNYAYQSNTIKVGNRVDSIATFNFAANKSLSADNYYRNGNSVKYKNKFHLLEMPFLLQWTFSKKLPVYFIGGPTLGYLVNSNALVYSGSSNTYFTDAAIFNKLLLSFNAGAGIDLAQKTKWPFSVGYQFKYSAGSVTKTAFGKQHFVNSLLYIKIPFKK